MSSLPDPRLYALPRRQHDAMGGVLPLMGMIVWVVVGSCWIATQEVAREFSYQASLGRPLWGHVYSPFAVAAWAIKFDHPPFALPDVHAVFVRGYSLLAFGLALGVVVAVIVTVRRLARSHERGDLHGSAHWASAKEVREAGLIDCDQGVYVGAWRDARAGRSKYLRDPSGTHCLAFMPTGSGKTVGFVITTLLSWARSAVVHDAKGELWETTAGWRAASREMGGLEQRVYKFEPTVTDGSSVHLNPLDRIRLGTEHEVQDCQNIVELIADEGDRRGDHRFWVELAKRLLLGLILHVKHDDDPRNDSLPGIAAALADPRYADFDAMFEHLRDYPHDPCHTHGWQDADGLPTATHPLVAQIATQMLAMEKRVKANIIAEAQSFLTLYVDPVIRENISSSDFDLADLASGDVSLYLVVRPVHKKRLRPLTRLILTQIFLALLDRKEKKSDPRVLIMLEEFAELGELDVVATALGLGRGYGLKLYLIVQDLSQLESAWGRRSKTIIANCAIRIASAPNDLATAELLSKMCGTMTVRHTVRNYSGKRMSLMLPHTTATDHDTQRALLTPDEVMRLPGPRRSDSGEIVEPGNILVFVSGRAPILGVQPLYFRDRTFAQRASIPPPEVKCRG